MTSHNNIENKPITFKQFDTFAISCEYTSDDDVALPLGDVLIYADMQSMAGVMVDRLAVTIIDNEAGLFELMPTVQAFGAGTYKIDILFEQNGRRVSSETFMLNITSAVTVPRMGL